jgi:tRNA 2-selenouridine synthase
MIDLEGLANHRGSLFGGMTSAQPAQKMFETRLAQQLRKLDPARVTWVEAESSKVGDCTVPPSLWAQMQAAPRVEVTAPLHARAAYLTTAYADLTTDAVRLKTQIDMLRPYHAGAVIDAWQGLAGAGDFTPLAAGLIDAHYDPRYAKSAGNAATPVKRYALDDLDAQTLAATAKALHAAFS